jgi:hypothetical protein
MSQFKGTYVFKQNGVEIGRSTNLITSNGRKMILQYLSGGRQDWAADMAIGALNSPSPALSDLQLNFETARYAVNLKTFISANTIANNPDLILVRATLPADLYANIYEIGLYATSNSSYSTSTRNNVIINDFSNLSLWNSSAGTVITNPYIAQGYSSPRIGANSVSFLPSTTYTNSNLTVGFSNYTPSDSLQILVFNTTAGTINVTITYISGITQTLAFTTTSTSGYSVLSVPFDTGLGSSTNSIVNFSKLTYVSISTTSGTYATIDAIKVSSASEISVEESLVSKSILTNPIAKSPNVPLDVEYYVEML